MFKLANFINFLNTVIKLSTGIYWVVRILLVCKILCDSCLFTVVFERVALLLQRGRAMLCVRQ